MVRVEQQKCAHKSSTTQDYSKTRLNRWRLLKEAQALLPDERVAFCKRRLQAPTVDILYSEKQQTAHYKGLMSCGSVWHCPICAAKISEHRRTELELAIARCKAAGGIVCFVTYTIAHTRQDNLATLLHSFLTARKKSRQGRKAQQIRRQFGILGTVSVREITWSEQNGWHPHCHELVFFEREIDAEAYANIARERWYNSAENEGLSMNEHGFQLDTANEAIASYIAKFGREPQKDYWGLASEMTKSHMKQGHNQEHLTPFAILARIAQGNDELKPIFQEYAQWFKGKHQLVWSAGLRTLLLEQSIEQADIDIAQEDIAGEETQDDLILLAKITREQWMSILRAEAQGHLLEIARLGNHQLVTSFIEGICVYNYSAYSLLVFSTKIVTTNDKIIDNPIHKPINISNTNEQYRDVSTNIHNILLSRINIAKQKAGNTPPPPLSLHRGKALHVLKNQTFS